MRAHDKAMSTAAETSQAQSIVIIENLQTSCVLFSRSLDTQSATVPTAVATSNSRSRFWSQIVTEGAKQKKNIYE